MSAMRWTQRIFSWARAELPPGVMPAPPDEPTARVFGGRYRLERFLGRGSTAVVYQATDLVADTPVALKAFLGIGSGEADALRREQAAVMRLSHPGIVRLLDIGEHDGLPFLALELVAGESAHAHAKRLGSLAPADVVEVGLACLDALEHAHQRGVTHGDVKPSNVLLGQSGDVKLCDFGMARLGEESTRDTTSQTFSTGSPPFMSPERIRGESCGPGSDLYSLAATLYALVTGEPPFGSRMAIAWCGHLEAPPLPDPKLPEPLFEVLRCALEKMPAQRFPSAAAMKQALLEVQAVPVAAPLPALREGMIWVPPGTLRSRFGGEHSLAGFWIDKLPVTNAAFGRYLEATKDGPPPQHWRRGRPPPGKAEHPVVGVSFEEARRYAAWAGGRLCTNLEWEAAACGFESRPFPWGEEYDQSRCNGPERGIDDTCSVGSHPRGATPEGCLDLVGNAWEWVESDARAPRPDDGHAWVFGGSFRHPCAQDGGIARTRVARGKQYDYLGFRCAAAGEPR